MAALRYDALGSEVDAEETAESLLAAKADMVCLSAWLRSPPCFLVLGEKSSDCFTVFSRLSCFSPHFFPSTNPSASRHQIRLPSF